MGSGAGHWVDFYREVLGAQEVVGIEISEPGAAQLRRLYAGTPGVTILEADVSSPGFELGRTFELASAVDVLFHVVSDAGWGTALDNVARHLVLGGRLVVAEHVGLVSMDVGFHKSDRFESPEEARATVTDVMLVGKRIRSARRWRERAKAAGLVLERSKAIRKSRAVSTPANRVLVFRRSYY